MKKVLLSAFVIVSFILYSLYGSEKLTAILPAKQFGPTPIPSTTSTPSSASSVYKDGTYTGSVEDVFYGNIQVQATVTSGRIEDITFLEYPDDRQTSMQINEAMIPILTQEAIAAQDSQVDIVSGATDSSQGFIKSLANALAQAK